MPDITTRSVAAVLRPLMPLAALTIAGISFILLGGHRYLTFSALADNKAWLCGLVAQWGMGAAILYILVYAVTVALSVPGGAVLTISGGFLFGAWLGGACALIGATAGATCVFLAARAGLGGLARRAQRLEKLKAGFRANAFSYLLVLRLVPLFPFWIVNLVPALAGVGLRTFLLATVIGIIPATFVYASLGAGLGEVLQQPDLRILLHPSLLAPTVGLAVLALIPVWYKRRQLKKSDLTEC